MTDSEVDNRKRIDVLDTNSSDIQSKDTEYN